MSKDSEDDDEGRPLTAAERRVLRQIIENEERMQWFWSSLRIWSGWIAAAVIGAWSILEVINKFWKKAF